jgi:hypothetical protein
MVTEIRPSRGGFLRPFGCGWFIREFLLGHGPEGRPKIDPGRGAPQADICYHYKLALHTAYAEDATAWENDRRIKAGLELYTELEYAERVDWHLRRTPYKLVKCRYHSFQRYFHWLKQLGWVELTGVEERSSVQETVEESRAEAGLKPYEAPPRKYYRLTKKGVEAPDYEWSNPLITCHPEINGMPALEYFREKRKGRLYVRKSPTKRRSRVKV